HLTHQAHRFGGDGGDRFVDAARDGQPGATLLAEQRVGGQSQTREDDVGGASVVDRAVGVDLHTGRRVRGVEVDEEQRDAVGVGALARRAGGDEQVRCERSAGDDGLLTVDDPLVALATRGGGHVVEDVSGGGLG